MTDTPAAPHTPSDDPRVELAAMRDRWRREAHRLQEQAGDDEDDGFFGRGMAAARASAALEIDELLARLDAAAPAPESPREERDRLYRDHVQACTDPRHKHPALDTPNDTPRFDWQAAEEGFVPCARGQRCELQLVRPGKVQCDCDTPGTEAAIARAEAEAAPPARDDALDRWLDTEIAEAERRLLDRDPMWRDGRFREQGRLAALREVRDRLGATTNTTPEEGTDD